MKHVVVKQLYPNKTESPVSCLKEAHSGIVMSSAGEPLFCDGVSQRRRLNVPHPELPQIRPLQSHVRALVGLGFPLFWSGTGVPSACTLLFPTCLTQFDLNSKAR